MRLNSLVTVPFDRLEPVLDVPYISRSPCSVFRVHPVRRLDLHGLDGEAAVEPCLPRLCDQNVKLPPVS